MKCPGLRILIPAALCVLMCGAAYAQENPVFAHYMPWFKAEISDDGMWTFDHWQWYGKGPKHDPEEVLENGKRDIASVYYPLIGPYDGRDPDVLEYHFLTAKTLGIAGFIADWYGPGDFTDTVFAEMLKQAEKQDMQVAICLEEKTFFPAYSGVQTREEVLDVAEKQIRHVLDTYASSSAYLKYKGRPVFLIFNGYGEAPVGPRNLSPDELGTLLARFSNDLVFVRGNYEPDYLAVTPHCYTWTGATDYYYKKCRGDDGGPPVDFWLGVASPGFDDTGVWGWGNGPRVVDRRDTLEYRESWQYNLDFMPPAVQIATWNDFQEGTTIEPAEEYGFTYADLTEEFIGAYNGRKVNLKDNQIPHRLYQLRKQLPEIKNAEKRQKMAKKLDKYAESFSRGRRFLMYWKLKRLEKAFRSCES
ncbi:MAG: hypothetical protein EOM20_18225 [Spartobacteria bacterium]|nr:hypothetical protein [Spartobacteria bacterium]